MTNKMFLYLIIFSLPLYLVRFSVFGLKTNALDILLVLFIVWQFINSKSLVRLPRFFRSPSSYSGLRLTAMTAGNYLSPIILILIGTIIATLNSDDIFRSLGILKSYFILPILFFLLTSAIVKTQEQKEKILKSWFLSGFIVALIGVFYWIAGDLTYDGRLRAFFESPNQLAMFLAPAFIIGNYLIILNRKPYQNLPVILSESASRRSSEKSLRSFAPLRMTKIQLGMAAVIGIAIFLTKSLGAIVATIISLPLFFIFRSHFPSSHLNTHRHAKMGSNFLSITIIILLLVVSCLLLVAKKDFSERSSMASRITIWQSAGTILKNNWMLGIGPGTFQEKYLGYQEYFPPYLEWASPQPHNILLAFWLQTGIVGFVGFLWLIFIFFKNVWRNKSDSIIFLSGVLMIYTLMHGMIDTTYWRNDLAVMFWVIILLSLNLEPVESSARQD